MDGAIDEANGFVVTQTVESRERALGKGAKSTRDRLSGEMD
jgi:hypothetical protein